MISLITLIPFCLFGFIGDCESEPEPLIVDHYAFEYHYVVIDVLSKERVNNAEFTFEWFGSGEKIEPEYWYSHCIENCYGYDFNYEKRKTFLGFCYEYCDIKKTEPVYIPSVDRETIVVRPPINLLEFTINSDEQYYVDWELLKDYNGITSEVDYRVDKFGKFYYTANMTHILHQYEKMGHTMLPLTTIFIPVVDN